VIQVHEHFYEVSEWDPWWYIYMDPCREFLK